MYRRKMLQNMHQISPKNDHKNKMAVLISQQNITGFLFVVVFLLQLVIIFSFYPYSSMLRSIYNCGSLLKNAVISSF